MLKINGGFKLLDHQLSKTPMQRMLKFKRISLWKI